MSVFSIIKVMRNNKWVWRVIGIAAVLGILFYIPRMGKKTIATDVPCLTPNMPLLQHIHPILKITVDDAEEIIPANIGLGTCERAIHTHDGTGTLHVEAQDSRKYTLGDFFNVWGKTIKRPGYAVTMTVGAKPSDAFEGLILKDKQKITLSYIKK